MKHILILIIGLSLLTTFVYASSKTKSTTRPFTIAWGLQPISLDPHYRDRLNANRMLGKHVFDSLFELGKDGDVVPVLVESYHLEDPYNWLFKLKENIHFHDGNLLTSDDVIATFNRLFRQPKDNAFRTLLGDDISYKKVSTYRFKITTNKPTPDFLRLLRSILIISKHYEMLSEQAFDNEKGLVGTGPYRWVKQHNMKRFELKAFDGYHGKPPFLKQVVIEPVKDKKRRLEGFITGQFDLIDRITPADMMTIQASRSANFAMPAATKLYHMGLDSYRKQSPFVHDHSGKILSNNPLRDKRVRKAMSKAIDRQALVDTFFGGTGAIPTGQLVSQNFKGYMPRLTHDKLNIAEAKALLKEAGYPKGFRLTIHDKDARRPILEAIAEMLGKIGIATTVETFAPNIYFPRASKHEFSATLASYNAHGYIYSMMADLLKSDSGSNFSRYSNPDIDSLLEKAQSTFDTSARYRQYSYTMELAMDDMAIIPLYFVKDVWVINSDLMYMPPRNYTLAQYVMPKQE